MAALKGLAASGVIVLPLVVLGFPPGASGTGDVDFRFEEVALAVGVDHTTLFGGEDFNRYLVETTGAGAAFIDFDNDGRLDIFLVNGRRLDEVPESETPLSRLYRNNGDGTFRDVTEEAGLNLYGWGQAVCAGDYDNDGFDDLFVTFWGRNVLLRNNGDGTFSDVTEEAALEQERLRWNSGCAFLDYDRDGHLDLFVANYVDFDLENTPTPDSGICLYRGVPVACGPAGLQEDTHLLYRNNGDGTFRDVSEESGITRSEGAYGLGVLVADFDGDGWPDVYVANDSKPSALYRNNKDGTFTDIGLLAGVALSIDGKTQAGMGVAAGDYDRDGRLDIFKTNFSGDTSNLYRNLGNLFFEDKAFSTVIGSNTRWLGWGCGFADFNNNGWLDIFQVNGHVYPEVDRLDTESPYRQTKLVYLNESGRLMNVSDRVGAAVRQPQAGRGAAFGDFDNDGAVDVLVNNVNSRATLYRTVALNRNHWLAVRPLGVVSNRSGIGARVEARIADLLLVDEVRSGGSYFSQSQFRVHFGLGKNDLVDELVIRWPAGTVDRYENVGAGRILYAVEGTGLRESRPAAAEGD